MPDDRSRQATLEPELLESTILARSPAGSEIAEVLGRFYREGAGRLLWLSDGQASPAARSLPAALRGLPEDVSREAIGLAEVESALAGWRAGGAARDAAAFEVTLGASFTAAGAWLGGRGPGSTTAALLGELPRRAVDLVAALERVAAGGEVAQALAALEPSSPEYRRLLAEVPRYRQIAERGDLPLLPFEPGRNTLEPAQPASPDFLALLAQRLAFEGFAPEPAPAGADPGLYSPELAAALTSYQAARGLLADGKLGRDTLAALNVSARGRLAQLVVNLARWRALAEPPAGLHVTVNVPAFRLSVRDGGRELLSLPVVVGKKDWPTPAFADEIVSIVLNPAWNVPESILREEILAKIQADPTYLEKEGIEVLASWAAGAPLVDAGTIDWPSLRPDQVPYRLRQRPGKANQLGRIKIDLPNHHDVYLHDTPAKSAFLRANRAVSHGCVRVQEPFRLAELLVKDLPAWREGKLQKAAAEGVETTILLPRRVPIFLTYFTAEVGEDGTLELFRDVYGWDEEARQAQTSPAPQPAAPPIAVLP
ncbi:MAG TPA: L,D-transpeptidase family protein [Thermoanaerobaculia bacterium]|nr:L,D-transpeptidase family protein [Thermoanaerobaculia bacterium]